MIDLVLLNQSIADLDEDKVFELLETFMSTNPTEEEALKSIAACQEGMATIGEKFETGDYFVSDLMFSGELLSDAINILKPALSGESSQKMGTILLGTVYGDLHDIGKNIFKSMADAAGFGVVDIGIDVSIEEFIKQAKELKPDIIGLSGVLTLAIDSMKDTVEALKAENINAKIIIGGTPVNPTNCEYVGADAFTTNAAEGVKICKSWI